MFKNDSIFYVIERTDRKKHVASKYQLYMPLYATPIFSGDFEIYGVKTLKYINILPNLKI